MSSQDITARAAPRPQPDSRGIISFPNYQVVVAQGGDRLGFGQGLGGIAETGVEDP